jgi:hypothetical protein
MGSIFKNAFSRSLLQPTPKWLLPAVLIGVDAGKKLPPKDGTAGVDILELIPEGAVGVGMPHLAPRRSG